MPGFRPLTVKFALPGPVLGDDDDVEDDPLFFEYFHGETGEGLGASHQTGWTALVAALVADRARA